MDDATLSGWWERGGLVAPPGARVVVSGSDPLGCRHRAGEAAAAALGLGAAWSAAIWERRGGRAQTSRIDVRSAAASLVGFALQRAPAADLARNPPPFTKLYPTGDGRWIHLHGGFPHLAAGLVQLLGCEPTDEAVAAAVATWDAEGLEDAIATARLCGAVARSPEEWREHPQGRTLASCAAVTVRRIGDAPARPRRPSDRPLDGVRVADLTRVLAGPTCGRTLAAHGADVLRLASPHLPSVEPYVVETGHGKRNAFVDLEVDGDLARVRELLRGADVVCQSYRPGSLAARGLGPVDVATLAPGVVYVSINCYGHSGPWAARAGWEQLAQTVSGIAVAEGEPDAPRLLPAAATDYTTGYLAAAGVLQALARQIDDGGSWLVEASLCQTSRWLQSGGLPDADAPPNAFGDLDDLLTTTETAWGSLTHLRSPVSMELTPPRFARPPSPLGSHEPAWL